VRLATLLAAGIAAGPALACGPGTPVGADGTQLAYRVEPAAAVGKMVAVEVAACDGLVLEGFDARMPVHGHGLNYRPRITAAGPGRYRVEGILFHMPGPWQFVFDVRSGNTATRMTADLTISR
jgi:hypothetical protein